VIGHIYAQWSSDTGSEINFREKKETDRQTNHVTDQEIGYTSVICLLRELCLELHV